MSGRRDIDGASRVAGLEGAGIDVEVGGGLVYEGLLPALPASVPRMRGELGDALVRHDLAVGRRDDILLVITEAATNAVWHGYLDTRPGPLYMAARIVGDSLIVAVVDRGRGMRPRARSPGLGLGLRVMKALADDLQISSDAAGVGTCVQATFAGAAAAHGRRAGLPVAPALGDRGEMLREYLQVLTAAHACLQQETRAVLAQAEQAVAHARRQQREWAGGG